VSEGERIDGDSCETDQRSRNLDRHSSLFEEENGQRNCEEWHGIAQNGGITRGDHAQAENPEETAGGRTRPRITGCLLRISLLPIASKIAAASRYLIAMKRKGDA
jgi:hypothetical protein